MYLRNNLDDRFRDDDRDLKISVKCKILHVENLVVISSKNEIHLWSELSFGTSFYMGSKTSW